MFHINGAFTCKEGNEFIVKIYNILLLYNYLEMFVNRKKNVVHAWPGPVPIHFSALKFEKRSQFVDDLTH